MQYFRGATAAEIIAVRVDTGEDLLAALTRVVTETGIAAGAVVSGCGILEHFVLEVPANKGWPPAAYAVEKEGPAQIVSAQGHIVNGAVDLYLTLARRNEVFTGEVMPGTLALHFAEFTILRAGNTRWTRVPHPQTAVPLLQAAAPAPAAGLTLMGKLIDPAAVALVPAALMQKHGCLPVAKTGDTLVVAMVDPNNPFAIDDLREATRLRIQAVAVPAKELLPALQQALAGR